MFVNSIDISQLLIFDLLKGIEEYRVKKFVSFSITVSSAVIATVDLVLLVASVNIAESIVVEEVVESLI